MMFIHSDTQDPERIVNALFVSPFDADHEFMRRLFARTNWKLHPARSYREASILLASEPIAVIMTDRELPDGRWEDLLVPASESTTSPVVVVTYRFSEVDILERLLGQGAYDVIPKPFEESEVSQIISFAWLRWRSKRKSQNAHSGSPLKDDVLRTLRAVCEHQTKAIQA